MLKKEELELLWLGLKSATQKEDSSKVEWYLQLILKREQDTKKEILE